MIAPGDSVKEKLNTSLAPGVYRLKDGSGKTLYVGKAKSLRDRLRSHFCRAGSRTSATA